MTGTPQARAIDEGHIRADTAVTINGLVRWTINHGCAGLEAWAGTPGTVGGAICGNAHFNGRLIGDLVETMGAGYPLGACEVSGAAYLITGLHPDGDDALSDLIAALRQAANEVGDEDERGRLRRAADGLAGIGRDVGAGVLTAVLTRYAGGA